MLRHALTLTATVLFFVISGAAPVKAGMQTRLQLEPCEPREGVKARCGAYHVEENRDLKKGRRIPLNMIVLPATGKGAKREPLFFLSGGPGEAATDALDMFLTEMWEPVRATRDIVLVDQRGTGKSNGLSCPLDDVNAAMRAIYVFDLPAAFLDACRAELERRADLSRYTTPEAMDDLDEVRAALGYKRIVIYGASYGTRAAFVYMRRHPEHVRSALLRAIAPVNMRATLPSARHAQYSFEGLVRQCSADTDCAARHPALEKDLARALERLDAAPAVIRAKHPRSGAPVDVEVTRDIYSGALQWLLYAPEGRAITPHLISSGARGDFAPFVEAAMPAAYAAVSSWSIGMALSVICSEDNAQIDPHEIPVATAGAFMGEARIRNQLRVCAEWPKGDIGADYFEPVRSAHPVLMISGEYDPIDGLDLAIDAARHLPNAEHVIIPGGAHQPQFPGCTSELALEFLETNAAENLDLSCVGPLVGERT